MPDTYYWSSISSTDPTNSANWTKEDGTTGTLPATGDTVYVVPIAGLTLAAINAADQHSIVLAALYVSQGFAATIGTNAAPGGYWQIGASKVFLGVPVLSGSQPTGSGRIKIDLGSNASVVTIYNTGSQPTDAGFQPTRIIGSAITTINQSLGIFGLATNAPSETSTVTNVNVTGGTCTLGGGVTWTTATCASAVSGQGTLNINSAGTTLTSSSGATVNVNGTGAITTVNAGGQTNLNNRTGSTDVTTLNLYSSGVANFAGNPSSTTIGTMNQYGGGAIGLAPAVPNQLTITTTGRFNMQRISFS
jgi:hypothetical protein